MEQQNQTVKQNGAGTQPAADSNIKQTSNSSVPSRDACQKPPTPSKQAQNQPSDPSREQASRQGQQGQPASHTQGQGQGQKQASGSQTCGCGQTAGKPDAMTVLMQTPVPPVLCDWLVCMRKPALSMQYSFQKRHIPDLDTDGQQNASPSAGNTTAGSTAADTSASQAKGVNSDTMGVQGDFTIRYFDLAAGALAMVAVGCLIKTCCYLKRKIL